MDCKEIAAFAREFRTKLAVDGLNALRTYDWAWRFWETEFTMDDGQAFYDAFDLPLGDMRELRRHWDALNDLEALGNGAFSLCTRLTYGHLPACHEDLRWLDAVLKRIEVLTARSGPTARQAQMPTRE